MKTSLQIGLVLIVFGGLFSVLTTATHAISAETSIHDQSFKLDSTFDHPPKFKSIPRSSATVSIRLGQLLFYDPILSGNQNISCATCHHPHHGTSDDLSLSLGEGGIGLGRDRRATSDNLPEKRIPRNSPALWNLGAEEFQVLFHDGRLENDPQHLSGIRTPLGSEMVEGFDDVLAAQTMFPVLSADEMAGHYNENDIARMVRLGRLTHQGGAWDLLAQRVANIDEYVRLFNVALGSSDLGSSDLGSSDLGSSDLGSSDDSDPVINFANIANVIADFIRFEWRADNSAFDRYVLFGEPLNDSAYRGMKLFYGKANCSACHSGWFQTDHQFHAIAMPQFGPGKVARFENHQRDVGRFRVTGNPDDAYRFRTPALRNVAHTAPYGHSGAYVDLESVIRHHLNPVQSLHAYQQDLAILPELSSAQDWLIMNDDHERQHIAEANTLNPVNLDNQGIADLITFLNHLTDEQSLLGRLGIPDSVPSGLPLQ